MSKEESMFRYWVEKLKLTDWSFSFYYNVHADDMTIEDSCGCTSWDEAGKSAMIQILDPVMYGERVVPFDIEKTIVHELLHCKMSLIASDCDNLQERVAHQIIDDLAKALVDARRNNEIAFDEEDTDNEKSDD